MTYQDEITFQTEKHHQLTLLDDQLEQIVRASGVQTGVVHLCAIGSTAALTHLEYEPGLRQDLPERLETLMPPSRAYGHENAWHDGNAHSHLQAAFLGPDLSFPVTNGRPNQGTWQQAIHVECDIKPRRRKVVVTVQGE